jgi:hypothetical protein
MQWGVVICAAIVSVIAVMIVRAVAPDRRQKMRDEKADPEAMPNFLRRVRTTMFRRSPWRSLYPQALMLACTSRARTRAYCAKIQA